MTDEITKQRLKELFIEINNICNEEKSKNRCNSCVLRLFCQFDDFDIETVPTLIDCNGDYKRYNKIVYGVDVL